MIIPFPIETSLSFPVGMQMVFIKLKFQTGDDSDIILKRMMKQEDIPLYLEMVIMNSVTQFLEEWVQVVLDEEDEEGCMYDCYALCCFLFYLFISFLLSMCPVLLLLPFSFHLPLSPFNMT